MDKLLIQEKHNMKWVLAMLTICFGIFSYFGFSVDLPEPAKFPVKLPKDAIVMPSYRVQPGTFKLEVSTYEWFERAAKGDAPDSPIVSYGPSDKGQGAVLNYWLPRKDGTFFHAWEAYDPNPQWRTGLVVVDRMEIKDNHLLVYPSINYILGTWSISLLAIFGFFAILVFVLEHLDNRGRKPIMAA